MVRKKYQKYILYCTKCSNVWLKELTEKYWKNIWKYEKSIKWIKNQNIRPKNKICFSMSFFFKDLFKYFLFFICSPGIICNMHIPCEFFSVSYHLKPSSSIMVMWNVLYIQIHFSSCIICYSTGYRWWPWGGINLVHYIIFIY